MVKQSLAHVSPVLFVALRFWIAALLVFLFMHRRVGKIPVRTLCQGGVLSLVLMGGFVFQTIGLQTSSPSHSAFITSLSVLLVPPLGFVIYHHRPRTQTLAGIALATVGLFLMLVQVSDLSLRSGDLVTLIGAVMYGFQILFLGRFVSVSDYRDLMLLQTAGVAIFCTIAVPVFEEPFIIWNAGVVFALAVTGIFATAFAFFVQAWAQRLTTANHAALIFSLEPFFAALFAFWILDEILTTREWVGGVLVLTGILVSELQMPQAEAKN